MFASFSALASLLMFASSTNLVNAKMAPSRVADIMADDLVPFTCKIDINVTDTDANQITNSSLTIIENCIVSSFNDVHNPAVIQLYDANITQFVVQPTSSLTSKGAGEGNYQFKLGAISSGARCRNCCSKCRGLGDDFFIEWQVALDQCLLNSNGSGLDGVTTVSVAARIIPNPTLEDAQDGMVPFEFNIHLTATDADSNKITHSSKTAVEGCIVSSFNGAHEPKVIHLNDATLTKLEMQPTTMTLLRGSLISTANYYLSGGASCVGGGCNLWKSMLGSSFFVEWQNALDTCIATSGVDGLAGVTDVTVTLVSSDAAAYEQ